MSRWVSAEVSPSPRPVRQGSAWVEHRDGVGGGDECFRLGVAHHDLDVAVLAMDCDVRAPEGSPFGAAQAGNVWRERRGNVADADQPDLWCSGVSAHPLERSGGNGRRPPANRNAVRDEEAVVQIPPPRPHDAAGQRPAASSFCVGSRWRQRRWATHKQQTRPCGLEGVRWRAVDLVQRLVLARLLCLPPPWRVHRQRGSGRRV